MQSTHGKNEYYWEGKHTIAAVYGSGDGKKVVFDIQHNDTTDNSCRPLIEPDNTIIEIEADKYKNDF